MNTEAAKIFSQVILADKTVRIKLLGDSITHGVGGTGFKQNGAPITEGFARNPDGYCWAKRFKEYMEARYNCTVTNNACTGTRVEFIIEHFNELVDEEDDIILCTIGTNNRHQRFEWGERRTREQQLRLVYGYIVELYQKFAAHGKQVIFMANVPACAKSEQDGADYWRILHMSDIQDLYTKASLTHGFPLIRMYEKFKNYCELKSIPLEDLFGDGLHPNDRGYDVMFSLLLEELGIAECVVPNVSP